MKSQNQKYEVLNIESYTVPLCGNKHIFPYGKLLVRRRDGKEKSVRFGERFDGLGGYTFFDRRKVYVSNIGGLYSPRFAVAEHPGC